MIGIALRLYVSDPWIKLTDSNIHMQSLTEKELGHALFYALKREDFQHA